MFVRSLSVVFLCLASSVSVNAQGVLQRQCSASAVIGECLIGMPRSISTGNITVYECRQVIRVPLRETKLQLCCTSTNQADYCSTDRSRTRTSYVVTCQFGCGDGGSITSTGYGANPAEARSNAESRASIYCAMHGGITSYGNCTIFP
jgi:hypothetical protein